MNTDPSTPENDANLSGLGRALLETGGSKPSSGPWVPPTAEELGKLLPEYDILKMLGRGGMGAVYMGRQKSLDRPVAIKILSNTLDEADASFAERFKNEARAMGKLNHPGIVAVHDFGQTAGGLLYIVMEYVEGTDVARMIVKEGRLHTEHAMAITAHVCDALAYAHDRGIIHRDIKPANIMVGYDGVVKVADFGLAKMTHSQNTGLTQSGMAMGTLHYMAPEALMLGSAVDHRADIYAVGVMLYQMLTGKLPQGMFELPSLQIPGLDPRYDAIIAKALREDREQRYQGVSEMRRDLDGILTQPVAKVEPEVSQAPAALPTMARPQRPGGMPYRPPQSVVHHKPAAKSSSAWLVWVVLGVLALGGAYFVLNPASQKNRPSPDQTAPTQAVASTTTPATATKDAPFMNTLGMKFVPVPGTNILMCIHETRRQDYAAYAAEVFGVSGTWQNYKQDGVPCGDKDDHPVVSTNWEDAVAFCAWLSKKEGKTYRLPSDEEWSIAVGLGGKETRTKDTTPEMLCEKETTEYPWGGDYPPMTKDQVGNYADSAWHEKFPTKPFIEGYTDGFPTTAPVMSFRPNKLGLYDMGGNVWEWVDDWWNAAQEHRVMRGSSFGDRGHLVSSIRIHPGPTDRRGPVGFRCVVESAIAPAVTVSSSPAPPEAMKPPLPASTATFTALDQLPDFRTRVANYQKARHAQLAELTTKYRAALTMEKDAATKTGVLASVTSCDAAIANAADFAQVIEQNLTVTGVKPLPALATVADPAPPRLKELRDIFVREITKIENALVASLDQSLATVQASLVKADQVDVAKAVEAYREQVMAAFKTPPVSVGVMAAPSPPKSIPTQARIIQRLVAIQNVCAWPNLTLMPDGSVTAIVFNQPNHGITPGDLDCYASSDGLKWEKRGAVTAHEPDTIRMNHAAGLAGNGDLIVLCSGWTNVKQPQRPKQQPFRDAVLRSWVLRSKDGGRAWSKSEVFPASESGDWSDYVPFGDIWRAQDGTLRASCYQEHYVNPAQSIKSSGMRAWCFRSDDDGATWKPQAIISPTHNETNLFPLGGKSWLAAARDAQVDLIRSDDDGATWGQPAPATGRGEVNGHLSRLADKRLLLSYGVRSRGSQGVCAKLSSDEGRTWSSPIRLADSLESDCGYPSSVQLANGRIVTAYYSKRSSDYNGYHMGVVVWELAAASSVSAPPTANPAQASVSNFATATKDKPFVNSLGMKFVPVPRTKVLMCIHETRKKDFAEFDKASPTGNSEWRNPFPSEFVLHKPDDHPVIMVSWQEAVAFASWLTACEGVRYRLPTDDEWSKAVGDDEFPWGREWPPSQAVGNYADESTIGRIRDTEGTIPGYTDGFVLTAPVMSFAPNGLGIYDLGGNVWEWCDTPSPRKPGQKILRGAAWNRSSRNYLGSTMRIEWPPGDRFNVYGFRIVLELSATTSTSP